MAMAAGGVPIFDFRVISDDGNEGNREQNLGVPWNETVWMSDPVEEWGRGEELGVATIYPLGSEGGPEFLAAFEFSNEAYPDVWVMGKVPGGDRWQGKGKANAKGDGRAGAVDIEFRNPKGWG